MNINRAFLLHPVVNASDFQKLCSGRQSEIKQISNLTDEFRKQFDILPEKIFLNLTKINFVLE